MATNTNPASGQDAINQYKELLATYQTKMTEIDFNQLYSTLSYQFISLEKTYEALLACKNNPTRPIRFGFKSYESVTEFYLTLSHFKKDSLAYFDKTVQINEVQTLAGRINLLVASSKDLSNDLKVFYPKDFFERADKARAILPEYVGLVNRDFVAALLNSALHELSSDELIKLVQNRIINASSFYTLRPENSMGIENFNAIKSYMEEHGFEFQSDHDFDIKLKGTTFNGKNGHSRQESLKMLSEFISAGNAPTLTLEQYTYTPEIGLPEPAFNVMWGDRDIGNLPKEVAKDLAEKFPMNTKEITNIKVSGGGSKQTANGAEALNYGAEITLKVKLLENSKPAPVAEPVPEIMKQS